VCGDFPSFNKTSIFSIKPNVIESSCHFRPNFGSAKTSDIVKNVLNSLLGETAG